MEVHAIGLRVSHGVTGIHLLSALLSGPCHTFSTQWVLQDTGVSFLYCCSVTGSCPTLATPWTTACQACLEQTWEFGQVPGHWVGDAAQPSHPLLCFSSFTISLSWHHGPFRWVGSSYLVATGSELRFRISPCNEPPGFISFRIDSFDLLAVQGAVESLLQHHVLFPSPSN